MTGPRSLVRATTGAVGFLTRVPVGHGREEWDAFTDHPGVIPLVGYPVGIAISVPLLLHPPLPPSLSAVGFVLVLYLVTGIANVDGLADFADGVASHGESDTVAVMKDTDVGVGGVVGVGLLLVGLYGVGTSLVLLDLTGVGLVIAAEVASKLAMATVIARGTATHEGLGEAVASGAGRWTITGALVAAAPAALLTWPSPLAAIVLGLGVVIGVVITWWTDRLIGGINGDVIGAAGEISRLACLSVGLIGVSI
ncbi:MAG: adenosylcobinamide-GDP ribazoletransferase [Halanaeroarchaeum sp.]